MSDEIEHEYTDEIVCPWCGYEKGDSWECDDEEDDRECGECGKVFGYNRIITVAYTSYKKKCEKCEYVLDTDRYGPNPYIYDGRNWTIYICKECQDEEVKVGPMTEDGKPYTIPLKGDE